MKKTIKRTIKRFIIRLLKKILPIPTELLYILAISFVITCAITYALYRVANVEPVQTYKAVDPVIATTTPIVKVETTCNPSTNKEVNRLLNKYFKTCSEVKTVWAIAQAESSGNMYSINKSNKNGSWDCGYLQANTIHRKKNETKDAFCQRMHNLEENIALASKIYKDAGYKFTPWVTFNNKLHLAYLK